MPAVPRLTSDRWRQIEDLFHRAMNCEPANRSAFLEQACGTDAELRSEVESLLANTEESGPDLEAAIENAARAYLDERSAPPIAEGLCLDQYRVIRMLGAGGMGEVYLAEDVRLKRKVALKILPSHLITDTFAMRRLQQEARIVSGLNHPNLLTVFEFGQSEGRHFLVTEFIEGHTVRELVSQGPLPVEKAVDITRQVAAALDAAHASGIIHRDIKPENIIVRPDGCVKVLDFGIAKLTEQSPVHGDSLATRSLVLTTLRGAAFGTPRYMSPEQARGIPLDARTDLFSLGAVLYEMLAGQPAFDGNTQSDLIANILRTDPVPLRNWGIRLPRALERVVARALAKDRDLRYQNADSLLSDLKVLGGDAKRSSRRHPQLFWAAVFLLAIAIVLSGVFAIQKTISTRPPSSPRTLAVLPFRNLRPDPQTDFLGVSLADEVITKLGYVKALTVRPSAAVGRYRNGVSNLHQAADDLNASMLLTGTYLRDGDDLRITARLVGVHPETVLWQDALNVKYDKLLTVQDQVARLIIQRLALRLEPEEQIRLRPDAPVNNLAYEYYLRGVDLYSASKFAASIAMLEKSVAIDPKYARTWAYLGRAYTTNGSLQFGGRENYRRAEVAYEKAIELDPVFADPRVYMANLFTDTGRVEEAVPLLRVALQSSPNDAEAHWELGYAYRFGGMLQESLAECELARRLDPEVKINSSALNTYLYLGEYEKFLNSLPANDSPLLVFYHGLGSYYLHNYPEAIGDFDRAFDLAPELLPAQVGKALSDGLRHRSSVGLARLHETEDRISQRGVSDPEALYKVAQAYALLGNRESALRMLQRSTVGGFFCYSYISRDPLLHALHNSPEFSQMLDAIRQRHLQFEKRFSKEIAPAS